MEWNKLNPVNWIKGNPELWTVALIVAIGAFLRFFEIGQESLWLDETYSVLVASKPIPDLLAWVTGDFHPPLYYLILHVWMYLGYSEFAVRSLSAVIGILTVVCVYYVSKTLFSTRTAVVAAFLVAISPMNIWYSQEARMYSLLALLCLLSLYTLYQALITGRKVWWANYVIWTTAMVYTHYYGFFILFSEFLFSVVYVILTRDKHVMVSYVLWSLAIVALFSPWMSAFYGQALERTAQPTEVLSFLEWGKGFVLLTGAYFQEWQLINVVLGFLWLSLFGYGIFLCIKRKIPGGVLIASSLLLTFALSFAISQKAPMYITRYTIFLVPTYAIIISFALVNLNYKPLRLPFKINIGLVALFIIIPLSIFHLSVYYPTTTRYQMREAAQYIKSNWNSEDIIIFNPGYIGGSFAYYSTSNMRQIQISDSETVSNFIDETEGYTRVWLVQYYTHAKLGVKSWLAEHYQLVDFEQYHGVAVFCYLKAGQKESQ